MEVVSPIPKDELVSPGHCLIVLHGARVSHGAQLVLIATGGYYRRKVENPLVMGLIAPVTDRVHRSIPTGKKERLHEKAHPQGPSRFARVISSRFAQLTSFCPFASLFASFDSFHSSLSQESRTYAFRWNEPFHSSFIHSLTELPVWCDKGLARLHSRCEVRNRRVIKRILDT